MTPKTKQKSIDGFNVETELSLQDWAYYDKEGWGEYIHLVPDIHERELRCYRSVEEYGQSRVATVITDVSFSLHSMEERDEELRGFYLTSKQAETFLTFASIFPEDDRTLLFEWWEETGMPMMEDEATNVENIILDFDDATGEKRSLEIKNCWQSARTHRMANIEGQEL